MCINITPLYTWFQALRGDKKLINSDAIYHRYTNILRFQINNTNNLKIYYINV